MARWRQKKISFSRLKLYVWLILVKRCLEPGWRGCVSGNQSCGTYINFLRKAEVKGFKTECMFVGKRIINNSTSKILCLLSNWKKYSYVLNEQADQDENQAEEVLRWCRVWVNEALSGSGWHQLPTPQLSCVSSALWHASIKSFNIRC